MIEIILKPLPIKPSWIILTYLILEDLIKPQITVHSAPQRQMVIITSSSLIGKLRQCVFRTTEWSLCQTTQVSSVLCSLPCGTKSSAGYKGRISWFSSSGRCKGEKGGVRPWKWCLWIFQFSAGHLNLECQQLSSPLLSRGKLYLE